MVPKTQENKRSYHNLHVTTERIQRTSIFDLPYGFEVSCNRVSGWCLWKTDSNPVMIAGEYDSNWLVLDIDGHVIVDSREDDNGS